MLETVKNIIMNPFVAGPLAGGFFVLLAYLESKYKDIKKDNTTYWKLFIASSFTVFVIMYLVSIVNNKTKEQDEFLAQTYDTTLPKLFPKSKGGYSIENQENIISPTQNIEEMMNKLPPVGTYTIPKKYKK